MNSLSTCKFPTLDIPTLLGRQRCDRQISMILGHSEDTHRVGMEASLLPTLHSNDGVSRFDNLEFEGALQAKAAQSA